MSRCREKEHGREGEKKQRRDKRVRGRAFRGPARRAPIVARDLRARRTRRARLRTMDGAAEGDRADFPRGGKGGKRVGGPLPCEAGGAQQRRRRRQNQVQTSSLRPKPNNTTAPLPAQRRHQAAGAARAHLPGQLPIRGKGVAAAAQRRQGAKKAEAALSRGGGGGAPPSVEGETRRPLAPPWSRLLFLLTPPLFSVLRLFPPRRASRAHPPPSPKQQQEGHYVYELGENISSRCEFFSSSFSLPWVVFRGRVPLPSEKPTQNLFLSPPKPVTRNTSTDKILSKFGEGTFGRVLECWDRLERDYVAVKVRESESRGKEGGRAGRAGDGGGGRAAVCRGARPLGVPRASTGRSDATPRRRFGRARERAPRQEGETTRPRPLFSKIINKRKKKKKKKRSSARSTSTATRP